MAGWRKRLPSSGGTGRFTRVGRFVAATRAPGQRPRRWRLLLLYGFMIYLAVMLGLQQVNLMRLRQQSEALTGRLRAARQQNQDLRTQVRALHSDAYLEKVAREDLGLTRQGEILLAPAGGE